jgi:hypothetical protein
VRLPRNSRRRTSLVLASAILAIGFGFCVLPGHHGDGGNHGHSPELCAGLVVILLTTTILLVKPAVSGWVVARKRAAFLPLLVSLFELPPEVAQIT